VVPRAKTEATAEIERPRERLHRVQTMLAYLAKANEELSKIADYRCETKHSYVRSMSHRQLRDFGPASNGFSLAIEIMILREFYALSGSSSPEYDPHSIRHARLRRRSEAHCRTIGRNSLGNSEWDFAVTGLWAREKDLLLDGEPLPLGGPLVRSRCG
jgi:hypothetical protein